MIARKVSCDIEERRREHVRALAKLCRSRECALGIERHRVACDQGFETLRVLKIGSGGAIGQPISVYARGKCSSIPCPEKPAMATKSPRPIGTVRSRFEHIATTFFSA